MGHLVLAVMNSRGMANTTTSVFGKLLKHFEIQVGLLQSSVMDSVCDGRYLEEFTSTEDPTVITRALP